MNTPAFDDYLAKLDSALRDLGEEPTDRRTAKTYYALRETPEAAARQIASNRAAWLAYEARKARDAQRWGD